MRSSGDLADGKFLDWANVQVQDARIRLHALWDLLGASEAERLEYWPAFSSQSMLGLLERKIEQLEQRARRPSQPTPGDPDGNDSRRDSRILPMLSRVAKTKG